MSTRARSFAKGSAWLSFALVLAEGAFGQSLVFGFDGAAPGALQGHSVSGAGDVDGDQVPDLVVGSPGTDVGGLDSGSVRIYSGATGALLHTLNGLPGEGLGHVVRGAGDVNADGFDDVIAGGPRAKVDGVPRGRVLLVSGLDGSVLQDFRGAAENDLFGAAVAGVGDLDGDAYDDIAIGIPRFDENGVNAGRVIVLSGATGGLLFFVDGDSAEDRLGFSVAGVGDVDGDLVPDLAVGAPGDDDHGLQAGSVRVFSGATSAILYTFHGDGAGDQLGFSVGAAGDANGDGRADVVAGADEDSTNGSKAGLARVFSGLDGSVLHTLLGDAANDRFGRSVAGVGDVDGDGLDDFVVGALRDDDGGLDAGSVRIYSGANGSLLARFDGAAGDEIGQAVAGPGDVNGDGLPEVMYGAVRADGAGSDAGRAIVASPSTLTLAAAVHEISLSAGGAAPFVLRAGAAHAGSIYWMLGSLSGTSPGIANFGGLRLPLNLDPYLVLTLKQPFNPLFHSYFGLLDENGEGAAAMIVPPGTDAEFVGILFHHAYVAMAVSGIADLISNPVPLTTVP